MEAYRDRPPYQRNDYIGWITRAKRDETKQRRLAQMLAELESGNRYMNMSYRPKLCFVQPGIAMTGAGAV